MKKKPLSIDNIATLILFAAALFGAWFRIAPAWNAGFPINDGGMFYTMILNLRANHYAPPLFTTYNHLNIPFAYPPLGFYVGAALGDLLRVSPLEILRWLPGIINALCIPAFYFFAKEILGGKLQSAIAALIYALIPHLTAWGSMGGGLTRSFGVLFMLLALIYIHRVFVYENKSAIWGAVIFGSLTVLSHTEAPIYTAAIALYIWAMKSRAPKGILNGMFIAVGVFLLSAPWYAIVIYRHGFAPLSSALQTGSHSLLSIFKILNIRVMTEESYLGLLGALAALGLAALLVKRDYFIAGMLLVIFIAQPRSAHVIGDIPLAMAAAFFVVEFILPWLAKYKKTAAFFAVLSAYLLSNSMYYAMTLSKQSLPEPERDAMIWVANHTPTDSKFLVVSGDPGVFCDAANEWFPALSERQSLTTIQGSEWLLGGEFSKTAGRIQRLQGCIDEGLECLARETETMKAFDYVYISINSPAKNCGVSDSSARKTRGLALALAGAKDYSIAYQSEAVIIFKK
ncbi:MAG: hypothetical protein PHQ36_10240 [Anaerolineales bacterium]|nr:hypothetical protein [Anaerolineales bacterium]